MLSPGPLGGLTERKDKLGCDCCIAAPWPVALHGGAIGVLLTFLEGAAMLEAVNTSLSSIQAVTSRLPDDNIASSTVVRTSHF